MAQIHMVAAEDHNPQNNKIEEHKSLGINLSVPGLLPRKRAVRCSGQTPIDHFIQAILSRQLCV